MSYIKEIEEILERHCRTWNIEEEKKQLAELEQNMVKSDQKGENEES